MELAAFDIVTPVAADKVSATIHKVGYLMISPFRIGLVSAAILMSGTLPAAQAAETLLVTESTVHYRLRKPFQN